MGRTKKPCPCCKRVDSSRASDDICYECRQVFNHYDDVLEILRDTQEKSEMTMPIMVGMEPHYNEYYRLPGYQSVSDRDFQKELQFSFLNLVKAASVQSIERHHNEVIKILGRMEDAYNDESHRLINENVGEAIMQLRELIMPLIQEVYKRGQREAEDIIKKYNEITKIIRR